MIDNDANDMDEEQNLVEALREAASLSVASLVPKSMLLNIADTLEAQEHRIDKMLISHSSDTIKSVKS